jgi:hypothetical protein
VPVLDSRNGQRDFQQLLLEVRVTSGSGKALRTSASTWMSKELRDSMNTSSGWVE